MTQKRVEWMLVIRYGKSAHRATYGRLPGGSYTKDYIQLYRNDDFLGDLEVAFPGITKSADSIPIEFHWPSGAATGQLVPRSADRPHLVWQTDNAPLPWKMSPHASELTVETILGDPNHTTADLAEAEFEKLMASDFGQPFLVAVKLEGEPQKLHLRVVVDTPTEEFQWAAINLAPTTVRECAEKTSQKSALAWKLFDLQSDEPRLYFDATKKTHPWSDEPYQETTDAIAAAPGADSDVGEDALPLDIDSDSSAESLPHSEKEVSALAGRLKEGDYAVADKTATQKTRGSAQKVFGDTVKENYGDACAITGIKTRGFLIASHIVPWSIDETIRLDPSNGICLSVLVDRAFEKGLLVISDDLTVSVDWDAVGEDESLRDTLEPFDGTKLRPPKTHPPKAEYLKRRRDLTN